MLAVGIGEGFTPGEIDREIAKMRDHQFHDARRDWDAVARNWLRTAAERLKRRDPDDLPLDFGLSSAKHRAHEANLQRAFAAPSLAAGPARPR